MTRRHILATLVFALGWVSCSARELLKIVSPGPGHPAYFVSTQLFPEALGRLGYGAEFVTLPPVRAAAMLVHSEADIYPFSDLNFGVQYPGVVRVDFSFYQDEIVAYSKSRRFTVAGWSSLKPYSIGFMRGMVIVEKHIQGMNIDPAESPIQAFDKLMAGRTELVVMPKAIGHLFQRRYPEVRQLPGAPLEIVPLYAFVSPRRAGLAPRLAAVFKEMQAQGRIQVITAGVEAELK